ncbi:wdr90 [Symbiodinium sp. CCMP2592]|nr:wdr90 [Symbiodinium sp. CCMP2592]
MGSDQEPDGLMRRGRASAGEGRAGEGGRGMETETDGERRTDNEAYRSLPSLVSVQALTFDGPSKFLAVSGQDIQNRQSLLVWDMSRADGGALTPVAKQTGPDVACLRFSPFEKLTLISCGMENVRVWRIKDSHLSGCMVPLGALARQMHFTALAFECRRAGHSFCLPSEAAEQVRLWVGTADGRVIELGHKSRKVLAVHQLHTQAITGLCANESFVVTASADRHVRVWPLDFRSFYLHALHETAVTGIDISLDGRQALRAVLVVCSNRAVLDVPCGLA